MSGPISNSSGPMERKSHDVSHFLFLAWPQRSTRLRSTRPRECLRWQARCGRNHGLKTEGNAMKKRLVMVAAAIAAVAVASSGLEAAEKFQKLSGAQVRAKLPGMEMTDEVHWRDIFEPNG